LRRPDLGVQHRRPKQAKGHHAPEYSTDLFWIAACTLEHHAGPASRSCPKHLETETKDHHEGPATESVADIRTLVLDRGIGMVWWKLSAGNAGNEGENVSVCHDPKKEH
jgi:hypothetical protein